MTIDDEMRQRLGAIGADVPLVLLPVRLETRFLDDSLLVRIYPDEIHQDRHDPTLTKDEAQWGLDLRARLGDSDDRVRRTAWSQLAGRFGPRRGAWIASQIEDLPAGAGLQQLSVRPTAWSRASLTRVLPERWCVVGYTGSQVRFRVWGEPVPATLATGPDPDGLRQSQLQPGEVDEGMAWMVDFDAALRVGMAVRVPLVDDLAGLEGLDLLLAFGIRVDVAGAQHIADLLAAHRYGVGLALIPQGTPTNNAPAAPSGYQARDPGGEAAFAWERGPDRLAPGDGSDGDLLANALGVPTATFARTPHADRREQEQAGAMLDLLWPATWGYYLAQLLGPSFQGGQPHTWRAFAVRNVRARGPLPALRVGDQPYGVLPVTALDQWGGPNPPLPRPARLLPLLRPGWVDLLRWLRGVWRTTAPHAAAVVGTGDRDQPLLDVLSQEALSAGYRVRGVVGPEYSSALWWLLGQPLDSQWNVAHRAASSATLRGSGVGGIDEGRLAQSLYASEAQATELPLVQAGPVSEEASLTPNYLVAMANAEPAALHRMRHGTLLFRLLRHATLLAFVDAALELGLEQLQETLRRSGEAATRFTSLLRRLVPPGNPADWPAQRTEIRALLSSIGEIGARLGLPEAASACDLSAEAANLPADLPRLRVALTALDPIGAAPSLGPALLLVQGAIGEPELVDLAQLNNPELDTPRTHTLWRYLVDDPARRDQLLLVALSQPSLSPAVQRLAAHRTQLQMLANLPTAVLDRLLRETLDLATYRLDAWITATATLLLRACHPRQRLVGGYGWVEGLRRRDDQPLSTGYIHAPSLTHGVVAAILRSAYLSHSAPGADGPLAIKLTSSRVRSARWLLDGVRAGQPVGALLGYRLERGLRAAGRPEAIAELRALAPLVARKLTPTADGGGAIEDEAAGNVVDGLALLRLAGKGQVPFGQTLPGRVTPLPADDVLQPLIQDLADVCDAVGDLALAESVFQLAEGNPQRAGASLDALSRGESPPAESDIASTPRTGVAVTHRVLVLFGDQVGALEQNALASWPETPRGRAEPRLSAWASAALGKARRVRCGAELYTPGLPDAASLLSLDLRLDELGLGALDVLALKPGAAGAAALEQLLAERARERYRSAHPDQQDELAVRLSFARTEAYADDELSVPELLEVAGAMRDLVQGARAVVTGDLQQGLPGGREHDEGELRARAEAAHADLVQRLDALAACLTPVVDADARPQQYVLTVGKSLADLRSALRGLVAFELPDAAPRQTQKSDAAALLAASGASLAASQTLLTAYARAETADEALRALFGDGFRALPLFDLSYPGGQSLAAAEQGVDGVRGDELTSIVPWFQRTARVREGLSRLDEALTYIAAAHGVDPLVLRVAQLPLAPAPQRWAGLDLGGAEQPMGGRLSLVMLTPFDPSLTQHRFAGLLVDDWTEVIPSRHETTSVAFHYDAPGACAPQATLIAVHPRPGGTWAPEILEAILRETIDLVGLRAVDPDLLAQHSRLGHFLPGIVLAANEGGDPDGDTVASDLVGR